MIQDQRELKRRLLLRLKGAKSGRALIGPATVTVHITGLCNLTCLFCSYHGPGNTHPSTSKIHLPFGMFESLVRDCADLQVDEIHLSGEGEPTLHPRFFDMLSFLENSFAVTIYSNGTFPMDRCRDILRADRIVINLGEADRESYRALLGRDLFVKVIKNIRELARLKPQINPTFCIEVVFITTRLNADSFLRTEKLVKKIGANRVRKRVFEESEHNRHLMLPDRERKTQAADVWPPCYYGWFNSEVRLNGNVNVCCAMQRLTIGNVYQASFKDVWGSDAYAQVRASALTGDPFRNYHECINCYAASYNKEFDKQMGMYNRMRKA